MEKKKLIMDDEIAMHETIANQVSISEQEDAYAALEAKYNNVEEAVEQDLLRAQFDRVDEDFEGQDMLAAQLDGVEDIAESGSGFVEEFEDNVIEENYIEEDDSDGWGSIDDNPYYNDNLDMDQQSPAFWDKHLWCYEYLVDYRRRVCYSYTISNGMDYCRTRQE